MKLAVVGSREFSDYELLSSEINKLNPEEIISGGANGADSLAKKYAQEYNIPLKEFLPDWGKYGKSAGFIRNQDIISYCDQALIFWNGESKGTKHDIYLCERLNKQSKIIKY